MPSVIANRQEPKGGFLSRKAAILAIFFMHSAAGGSLFTRIPDIQLNLGLSEGQLGLTLMGQPIGAFTIIFISSLIIEKLGTRLALSVTVPMIALSVLLFSLAPNFGTAFAAMFLYGSSFALCNVSMNVEADRVEAATGNRIMNRAHGMWSLGFLISSLVGAGMRGIPLTPVLHFAIMLPFVLAACAVVIWPMQASPPRAHQGKGKRRALAMPTLTTFMLVGFGIAAVIADGGTRNWSVIYMRDTFSAPDWIDTMTLPAFLATLTLGRLFADRWIERFGPARVVATLLSVALAGVLLVIFSGSPIQAIIGFAMMGLGICAIYPLMVSTAAQTGDREASQNVAAVSLTMSITMLGAPALMGFVADGFGIRMAFGILVPAFILSLVLTRFINFAGKNVA